MLIWCLIVIGPQLLIMVLISNVGKFLSLNFSMKTMMHFPGLFSGEIHFFSNITNVFITFDQCNMSLVNTSIVNNQKCF